jgi:23S rRNA (uridine2552-2'-O)-methyltransferase
VCELALDFAAEHLQKNGALLIKAFHGAGFDDMVKRFRATFKVVQTRKPKASRGKSAEVYLLGRGLK